ncbi:fimbrial biogenesis chaperone [Citrobacter koseri]|uniref:fimbrial biogenesis chaperone n=1 Tax=Citrobacter koseri TaxID=545 RepID=UPI000E04C174|nr:molecular chaperone [Citrobacter koseri]STB73307.1 fimbrial chaperone protein FimC [Citrobacter koseri]STT23486.1 putative fimbrial chaperone [Citrobacter koseri]
MELREKVPGAPGRVMAGLWPTLAAVCLVVVLPAQAFMLGGTRVILPEGAVVSVPVISGSADGTLLVKTRSTRDEAGKIPAPEVLVSPPLFRLDKDGRGEVRLNMVTVAGLPRDRESVRYLNVSGIPSTNSLSPDRGKVATGMVIGQGVIVKVFFRPAGLPAPGPDTWKALTATRVPGGVELSNPTPYYISFSQLRVDKKSMTPGKTGAAMLSPFSHQIYGTASVQKKEVQWTMLNDLGMPVRGVTPVR